MVDSREFQRAVDVAQREYLGFASSQIVDNNTAMAAGWKVKAVTEFCYMMRMLSEDLTPARPRVISGLDHTQ
jgi:hypothetical protein